MYCLIQTNNELHGAPSLPYTIVWSPPTSRARRGREAEDMFIILEIDAANQSAKSLQLSDGIKDQRLAPAEQERPPSELSTFATVVQRDINF